MSFNLTHISIGDGTGRPTLMATYEAIHRGPVTSWSADVQLSYAMPSPHWTPIEKPFKARVVIESEGATSEEALDKLREYCERTALALNARGPERIGLPLFPHSHAHIKA